MRSLRWLLLAVLVLIAAAVLGTYESQRRMQRAQRHAVPPALALDTKTSATDWEWGQSGNGEPKVKLFAKTFRQAADGNTAELQDIELRLYRPDGMSYDRVKSAAASFNSNDNKLFSPGEAEITMEVPVEGEPAKKLTSIRTSGITFDSKTGQASSDQAVKFSFANGSGTCTGASYDPLLHVLNLNQNVVLHLKGDQPGSAAMKIEAGHVLWEENTERLILSPWSKLTRGQTAMSAGSSVVQMKGTQAISSIDAQQGHGTDQRENRYLEYSADEIHLAYNEDGVMDRMDAAGNAKLTSHTPDAETIVSGGKVYMKFKNEGGEAALSAVTVAGKSVIESRPVLKGKGLPVGDTRIMKAEVIDLYMRPGGEEIERVATQVPGTLEFVPGLAARHRRVLKAARMEVRYGARNDIRSLGATDGSTETYPSEDERKKAPNAPVAYTSSKTLDAAFDDAGQLRDLRQTENFRYTEGTRKAQAKTAVLDNSRNVMTLETGARIADDTGSASADLILLDQKTGDFDARGHVFTTRLPELAAKKTESAMLDDTQPTQGTANRVTSEGRNRVIHYDGNAVVWQAANRIAADKVDIDRETKSVVATGKVVSQFQEAGKTAVTVVRAPRMVYTDQDRLALYSGGVDFVRDALSIRSATLRAFLNDQNSGKESRTNRALADGSVEIVQTAPGRKRIGTGEHGEYVPAEAKVVLSGGTPQLADSMRGNTKGDQLTYFTNDERLLVNGAPQKQAQSHLRKKIQ